MPETYGVMVYQEDVIKVAHHFAGLDLGEADVLRRGRAGSSGRGKSLPGAGRLPPKSRRTRAGPGAGRRSVAPSGKLRRVRLCQRPLRLVRRGKLPESVPEGALAHRVHGRVHQQLRRVLPPFYAKPAWSAAASRRRASTAGAGKRGGSALRTILLGFNLVRGIQAQTIARIMHERQQGSTYASLEDAIERTGLGLSNACSSSDAAGFGSPARTPTTSVESAFPAWPHKGTTDATLFTPDITRFTLPHFEANDLEVAFDQIELFGFLDFSISVAHPEARPLPSAACAAKPCRTASVGRSKSSGTGHRQKPARRERMSFGCFVDVEGQWLDTVHFPVVEAVCVPRARDLPGAWGGERGVRMHPRRGRLHAKARLHSRSTVRGGRAARSRAAPEQRQCGTAPPNHGRPQRRGLLKHSLR